MSQSDGEVFAALDLGSNSFHLLLARLQGDSLVVLDRYKDMVRLASGLREDGSLSRGAMERALVSLQRMAERMRPLAPQQIRVVGTNTLRAARNADRFLERAEAVLGVPINIISGPEEARLIYLGINQDFCPDDRRRLVIDIGGGSTELVLGRRQPELLESLYMGCVSFSQRFFPEGQLGAKNYQRALVAARSEVMPLVSQYGAGHWQEVVGSSGTIRAIESVLEGMGMTRDHVVTLEGLNQLAAAVGRAKTVAQLELPNLDEDRRGVFPGGLAVLHGVSQELGIDALHVSSYALREGMIFDLAGRHQRGDKREETIQQMMARYGVDQAQARRVWALAQRLHGDVAASLDTEPERATRLLRWAANLHEIGLSIAHSGYHKHGAYLVEHSDMPGFSRQEQKLLSFLVLNHRRKLKVLPQSYGFDPDWRLLMILRLAFLFNRRREDGAVPPGLQLSFKASEIRVGLPAGWLAEHPLTEEDLVSERRYLKALDFTLRVAELPALSAVSERQG